MPITFISNVNAITQKMADDVRQVIRETADDLAADFSNASPVLSGALRESAYVGMPSLNYDTYPIASAAADKAGNTNGPAGYSVDIVPEVKTGRDFEAIVGSAVKHAVYVEFGTTRMGARPNFAGAFNSPMRLLKFRDDLVKALTP